MCARVCIYMYINIDYVYINLYQYFSLYILSRTSFGAAGASSAPSFLYNMCVCVCV